MPYAVTFDAIAFSSTKAAGEHSVSPKKIAKFVKDWLASKPLPKNVLGVKSVGTSLDDGGKQDGEYKAFASVILEMDVDAYQWTSVPDRIVELLNDIIDLAPSRMRRDGSSPLDVHKDSWEALDSEEVTVPA